MSYVNITYCTGSRSKDLLNKVKKVLRTACYLASHIHLEKEFMSIQKCAFIGHFQVRGRRELSNSFSATQKDS